MPYDITNNQDDNLKLARKIARTTWQANRNAADEDGNTMRSNNKYAELISSSEGYFALHDVIFEVLENKRDINSPNYYNGLYQALAEKSLTFDTLKSCLAEEHSHSPR